MPKKHLIIGGVAAGMSAAARLRRLDESAEIIVFEKGDYISFESAGLPYYAGGLVKHTSELLARTPEHCRELEQIDVRTQHEVIAIHRESHTVEVRDHVGGRTYTESYDKLLLAPGSVSFTPPIEGINLPMVFPLLNIPDLEYILGAIEQNGIQRVTLVGGGYIGVELADNLNQRGLDVSIVELINHVLSTLDPEMAGLVHHRLREAGIELHTGASVKRFESLDGELLIHREGGETIHTDMAILALGIRPNSQLAQAAGLNLGQRGGVIVDEYLRTSDPDIYAAGDVIEVLHPILGTHQPIALGGPANKQGRIAAANMAHDNHALYHGTIGTSIARVVDLDVAATGATESMLKRLEIPHRSVIIHPMAHAAYFPDAYPLSIKLTYNPDNERILGGQVVGKGGTLKTIDLIAYALQHQGTVNDLADFEHAYAPAYSEEKDPVNMAGFVAQNELDGIVQLITVQELAQQPERQVVDLRDPKLYHEKHIPRAINLPMSQLRDALQTTLPDKQQPLVLCSHTGAKAYNAARVLIGQGYTDVRVLNGGYRTYRAYLSVQPKV